MRSHGLVEDLCGSRLTTMPRMITYHPFGWLSLMVSHAWFRLLARGCLIPLVILYPEVDEGTAIFKVGATQEEVPAEGNWLTLDADGEQLPNDWYLRLCGEAQKMLRGDIPLTDTIPISP